MVTLIIENAGGSQLTYQLEKQAVSVGASSRNDIVLRDPGVAPRHVVIQRNGDVFTFLGQHRQVVVLNGERRSRGVLKIGDKIRIGAATIVFKGSDEAETDVRMVDEGQDEADVGSTKSFSSVTTEKQRSEIVLFREPHHLSDARQQLVDLFRSRMRSDLVPSLRTFLATVFADRKALLALVDEEGKFEPVISQWEGTLPRLPNRTFEELDAVGRYAVLHLEGQVLLVFAIDRGSHESNAYVLAESTPENQDEDRELLGEFARMLSVHWDRVERSTSLYGEWANNARQTLEASLPGTSQAVRILRDSVGAAARSSSPVTAAASSRCSPGDTKCTSRTTTTAPRERSPKLSLSSTCTGPKSSTRRVASSSGRA